MNETRWTEGPWRAEGPDPFGDLNILHPADALAIAAVVSNMRPAEEVVANAHLIAAAPELYDALNNTIANERIAMEVLARARGEERP